jgi:hypothetical protein
MPRRPGGADVRMPAAANGDSVNETMPWSVSSMTDIMWSIGGISGLLILVYFGWRIIDKEKKSRM